MDVRVNDALVIPDAEIDVRFTPSGGPGGQHANRSNTRVELLWDVESSGVLSEGQRHILLRKLGAKVRVVVDDERSQMRNRDIARDRLAERVRTALIRPKKRRPTKPSRSSQRRRVESKRQRGQLKKQRRRPHDD